MKNYKIDDELFQGIKIPDKLREAIPSNRYNKLVDIFMDVITGYTAPSYDILLAIEEAIVRTGYREEKDRKVIKKERDAFLKQLKSYIEQRLKLDLPTL